MREIAFVAVGHNATEGRVGQYHIDPVLLGIVAQGLIEGIAKPDVGYFNVVQNQIGGRQQILQERTLLMMLWQILSMFVSTKMLALLV